jgi:hypothetical protein
MTIRVKVRVFAALAVVTAALLALLTPLAHAANTPNVNQDLAAVIALNGQPCGQVVSVERRGDNDYMATCSNGSRYHVFVREGRVVVQKQ